jgi:multiple sugar transport system permease protein
VPPSLMFLSLTRVVVCLHLEDTIWSMFVM